MRLSQAQVRDLADIPEQTFRVWREALPPLGLRSGKTAQFNLADVIAVAVIKQLVQTYGVRIQKLAPISPELFETCGQAAIRHRDTLVVSASGVSLHASGAPLSDLEGTSLVVPIFPIFEQIRARVMQGSVAVQGLLPLGPAGLPSAKSA